MRGPRGPERPRHEHPDLAGHGPDLPVAIALAARSPDVRAGRGGLPAVRRRGARPHHREQRDRRLTAGEAAPPDPVAAPTTDPTPGALTGPRRLVGLLGGGVLLVLPVGAG